MLPPCQVSDWVLDLVSTGFNKPSRFYGSTMRSDADVEAAARAFAQRQAEVRVAGSTAPAYAGVRALTARAPMLTAPLLLLVHAGLPAAAAELERWQRRAARRLQPAGNGEQQQPRRRHGGQPRRQQRAVLRCCRRQHRLPQQHLAAVHGAAGAAAAGDNSESF